MLLAVSALLTIAGVVSSYVAAGLARSQERERGYRECEQRLQLLRQQMTRRIRK